MARTIALLSGGIDSAVLLHRLAQDTEVFPIFVHYGQRAGQREAGAAQSQCDALGLTLVTLDVGSVGDAFGRASRVRPHVPLPHRNLALLSLALSYGAVVNADAVALSIIRDDGDWYASASQQFIDSMRQLSVVLSASAIKTPLIDYDKQMVVTEGVRLGVDFRTTYSCMVGDEAHCGRCHQCIARRAALARAAVQEPADFYRHG